MTTAVAKLGGVEKLSAPEQAIVDDLRNLFGKYRDRDPVELMRLVRVAFGAVMGRRETREHKLLRALARGVQAREELGEAEGGSFSSEEVARLLRISKTAVFKRLESGRLLAWREERLQAARFPAWQFDKHGQVLAGLEEVLAILNKDERLDCWGKMLFFLQQKSNLGDRRPLDVLREGKVKETCLAAESYIE